MEIETVIVILHNPLPIQDILTFIQDNDLEVTEHPHLPAVFVVHLQAHAVHLINWLNANGVQYRVLPSLLVQGAWDDSCIGECKHLMILSFASHKMPLILSKTLFEMLFCLQI